MRTSSPLPPGNRTRLRGAFPAAVLCLTAAALVAGSSALALPVRAVEEPAAAILDGIPEDPGLNNVTLTADGTRAAASIVEQLTEKKFRSTIHFYSPELEEPAQVTLSGDVRDLLFAPDGKTLFVLLHIPTKKRPVEVKLLLIDASTRKTRQRILMPPSALGLAYWPQGNAMLVVCAHEIRSVLLSNLRSGPLYRLIGVNTSAAILDGARLLVGREDGLSLIDLRDPPGDEQMPVRMRVESDREVVQVSSNRDATKILVRYLEGGIASVDLGLPALRPLQGDGVLPVRPWPLRDAVPGLPAEFETEPPAPEKAVATVDADVARVDEEAAAVAAAVAASTPAEADAEPLVTPEPESEKTAFVEPAGDTPPAPVVPAEDAGPAPQVAGKLTGPGADMVSSVVLFGPDNILREARRVTPDADGRWQVDGLQAGRYRVQLVADGDRVPVADPPFHVLDLQPDRPTVDASFEVLEPR